MKFKRHVRETVLIIGILLISLRLFIPVKEYQIYSDGIRVKYSSVEDYFFGEKVAIEKTVVVSKTIFQVIGIAVLTGGIILIYEQYRKNIKE